MKMRASILTWRKIGAIVEALAIALWSSPAAPQTITTGGWSTPYIETVEPIDIAATATFTNGSAVIGVTQTLQAGAIVNFTNSGGALPTNFVAGTPYYVLPAGLSGTQIEVSATPFDGAIVAGSAGTGTQTAHTEVAMTSTSVYNLATLQVTPGDWDCEGNISMDGTSSPVTFENGWISTISATQPPDPGIHGAESSMAVGTAITGLQLNLAIKRFRALVSVPTVIYLSGTATFSGGSMLGYGQLDCRRMG
jgi:hypothetical protein